MLLSNIDVQQGYANGTRVRLLPQDSWTGPNKQYKRRIIKKYDTPSTKIVAHHYNRRHPESRDVRFLDDEKNRNMKDPSYLIIQLCVYIFIYTNIYAYIYIYISYEFVVFLYGFL